MDKDEALDSIVHHGERAAKMRKEAEAAEQEAVKAEEQRKLQQAERDHNIRHAQADELEARMGLIREDESREMLLERIRKMREDVPAEPVYQGGYHSPEQQAQLAAEQKAGREAVAREEERMRRAQEARDLAAADEAVTVSVHHPNPSQDEQFPASKATLGKVKQK